jgi:hypothetical protein
MKGNLNLKMMGLLVLALFLLLPNDVISQNQRVSGSMSGFVFSEDMKTPVENAVVKIRNTRDGKEFTCAPTDKNGMFALKDIEEGRYILGISAGERDFNFGYTVLVKGRETANLALTLKPGSAEALPGRTENTVPAPTPNIREVPSFFPNPSGNVDLGPDNGSLIINCIEHPQPPKPPKSKHHPHH